MGTVLVTGGTGFIGSALVRSLAAGGTRVRVLDDGSRGSVDRLAGATGEVEVLFGDIRDPATVSRAADGVASIWHLAAINGTRFFYEMPERVLEVGIKGMLNVLDAARERGVGRILVVSSSEVYQTPPLVPTDETVPLTVPDVMNPRYSYGGSKIATELLAINYGRRAFERVVVVRPHNVYGPDMGWEHVIPELAVRISALGPRGSSVRLPIEGRGDETRAFCFVDDAVAGIRLAFERGQHLGVYHVGTDVETRIGDLAVAIGRAIDRTVTTEPGPAKPGGTPRRCPDISRLRALGFEPRVGLDLGLARTAPWYEARADARPRAPATR
ncbi:MAG TPA: SDR family NAD(P)-dependent oxidoreductase [Candidatus Limnocylindria bacterium]|nr:SDR family NAD(P)-dependent oxidoreductase [Candidatus Limnocylindria bacterium]